MTRFVAVTSFGLLFGGLDHHVAHHLFPTVPHVLLHRSRPVLRAFAARHALRYREETFGRAVVSVTRHLAAVSCCQGSPARLHLANVVDIERR
jgi:fatty acid desaturase